jgi:hypothetical protein
MNSLNFLKQAKLADQLGNFRLADSLYNRAIRTVVASAFDRALIEALEKAGIKAGEKASLEAVEEAVAGAIMTAIRTGESAEFRILAKEAGLSDETIQFYIESAYKERKFNPETAKRISRLLESKLNSEESIFERMMKDVPPKETPPKDTPPIETPPSKSGLDKIKDVGSKLKDSAKQRIDSLMKNPGAKKLLKVAGIIALVGASGWYFVSVNGEPVSDEEVENALSGSEMYDLRMQAKLPSGVSQQEFQGEKAQKFVTENKDKFTNQRDFYNAALGAGDKNFANSVIAIVKKDLSLPVESEKA